MDGTLINRYIESRQSQGVANGTINREMNVLSRMLRLGYERNKVLRLPVFHNLKEADPRWGFFEREPFQAVWDKLRPDLQVAVTIAYTFGWRLQSEVLALSQVNLEAGTLAFRARMAKDDEARDVYLTLELHRMVAAQVEQVRQLSRRLNRVIPHLFQHFSGRYSGERLKDFRTAWGTACRKAQMVGYIRHDFRRTAVRNLVNAGVPERVARSVTGHRTRSVFDRYHIVSPADLKAATQKLISTLGTCSDSAQI